MARFSYGSLTGWNARARIRLALLVVAERSLKRAEARLAAARREGEHPRGGLLDAVTDARKRAQTRREQRHDALAVVRRHTRKFERWMLNGHPGNVTPEVKATIVRAVRFGGGKLFVTSTTDGAHAPTSFHFTRPLGKAVDFGTRPENADLKAGFQRRELARGPRRYLELLGPDNDACVKNGERITLAEGSALEELHDTHTHVAPAP